MGLGGGVSRDPDWFLIGRYALLVALTALIPVPLMDSITETTLRRRMVRALAARHDVKLEEGQIRTLADTPGGGCSGCLVAVVKWPFEKLFKTVFFVLGIKNLVDVASEVLHRGLLLEEAFARGWLPERVPEVRSAMDRSLACIDTRIVERRLVSVFADHTNELNRAVHEAARLARLRVRQAGPRLADAADQGLLGAAFDRMVELFTETVHGTAVVPELLHWFRAEMGEPVEALATEQTPPPDDLPENRQEEEE